MVNYIKKLKSKNDYSTNNSTEQYLFGPQRMCAFMYLCIPCLWPAIIEIDQ